MDLTTGRPIPCVSAFTNRPGREDPSTSLARTSRRFLGIPRVQVPGKITGFASGLILQLPQIQRECGKITLLLQYGYANANLPLTDAVKSEIKPPTFSGRNTSWPVKFYLLRISFNPSGETLTNINYVGP